MKRHRVFTELQKPEIMFYVPIQYLLFLMPLPALISMFITSLFSTNWVLPIGAGVAVMMWSIGAIWTKIDPDFMRCIAIFFQLPKPMNWPRRPGKFYQG